MLTLALSEESVLLDFGAETSAPILSACLARAKHQVDLTDRSEQRVPSDELPLLL